MFKELKSRYAPDKVRTTNPQVIEALVWVVVLTLLVSKAFHRVVREHSPPGTGIARYTQRRWKRTFLEAAPTLLTGILV